MSTTYLGSQTIVEFVPVTCCHDGCGLVFGLADSFVRYRKADHAWWYCPNGHQQHWRAPSNETERLRKQLEASRRIAQNERDRRERAERRRAAAQGQVTKATIPCLYKRLPRKEAAR